MHAIAPCILTRREPACTSPRRGRRASQSQDFNLHNMPPLSARGSSTLQSELSASATNTVRRFWLLLGAPASWSSKEHARHTHTTHTHNLRFATFTSSLPRARTSEAY